VSALAVKTPAELVAEQLVTYNAQDMDRFMATYADDVIIADFNGAVTTTGKDALRARYAELFKNQPKNRADLVHRGVFGNKVVDHEKVYRDGVNLAFEVMAIYTIENGLIARVDFVK
jgi:hypothetical protein